MIFNLWYCKIYAFIITNWRIREDRKMSIAMWPAFLQRGRRKCLGYFCFSAYQEYSFPYNLKNCENLWSAQRWIHMNQWPKGRQKHGSKKPNARTRGMVIKIGQTDVQREGAMINSMERQIKHNAVGKKTKRPSWERNSLILKELLIKN